MCRLIPVSLSLSFSDTHKHRNKHGLDSASKLQVCEMEVLFEQGCVVEREQCVLD